MYRGGGFGSVVGGMVAVALGLVLTFISYQLATPGGTYFIFVGLIVGGLFSIVRGLATPGAPRATSGKYRDRKGPARNLVNGYVALPNQMPPGYCWQCGRKVKAGRVICPGCGATQRHEAPRHADTSVRQSEGDRTASAYPGAGAWESSPPLPPPRTPPSAEQRRGPMYQPGAPSPWDTWDARERPPDPPTRPRRR